MTALVDRPRAQQRSVAVLAAVGGDARHRQGRRLRRRAGRARDRRPDGRDRRVALRCLRPDDELPPRVRRRACARTRCATRKLTFGDRIHCPFLRPFFLTEADEARMRARGGDRRGARRTRRRAPRWSRPAMFDAARRHRRRGAAGANRSGLCDGQHRLAARRVPAAGLASLRGVQRRVAGRAGYTQRLCELFDALPVMARSASGATRALHADDGADARRAGRELPRVGRHRQAAARSPSSTGARCRPGREFEILRDAFTAPGVPTVVCDPRELTFDGGALVADGRRDRPRLPACAHERHHRAARRVRARWSTPTRRARCASPTRFRCKLAAQEGVLCRAHRRAQRAPVFRRGARDRARAHPVDPRRGGRGHVTRDGALDRSRPRTCARTASASCSSRTTSTAAPA